MSFMRCALAAAGALWASSRQVLAEEDNGPAQLPDGFFDDQYDTWDHTVKTFQKDFLTLDTNKDELLDMQEMRMKFTSSLSPKELYVFFIDVDKDDSGTLTLKEYIDYAAT